MYHYDGIEWSGFDLGSRSHLPPPRLTSGIGRITMSVYRKHQLVVPLNHAEELQDWMERIADSPDILKELQMPNPSHLLTGWSRTATVSNTYLISWLHRGTT